jgi:hypothetical protein
MEQNARLSSTGSALAPVEAQTQAQAESQAGAEIFREIDDPNGGARWLLSRDLSHPGGPGVLTPTDGPSTQTQRSKSRALLAETMAVVVIHAGDRLTLEEHSAVLDGRLEAVALGPAVVGSALKVRLTIGGKMMRARALAPGRAVLEPETESRP